ncbi:MAG: 23S rRNA (adenine(2030)-N(6))-methyltransferase RlmJ [Burkholderiaceae bacterium]|nr:23S rRNA (adenine(2030)-N(6))-methyltransferase RlmJ [Burkholderiaceae bacterium]
MFSYRHAFHAGNHADVLKHLVLVQLLRHLGSKDTPFWVIDTHAGAGIYALEGEWASKRNEFIEGIGRLWPRAEVSPAVADYLAIVRATNPDGRLRHYPGSPLIALRHLRDKDRLRLFELHVNESKALAKNIAELGRDAIRRTVVVDGDGFTGLQALLPPPPRRGLILIDPSYEDKKDYARVVATLRAALTRFATGCYMIWYPQVQRHEPVELVRKLTRWPELRWLHATLTVRGSAADGLGLLGSGVFVVNPPWTLHAALEACLPWLASVLGQDDGARWTLDGARL